MYVLRPRYDDLNARLVNLAPRVDHERRAEREYDTDFGDSEGLAAYLVDALDLHDEPERVNHVVADAVGSDLINGESPESWSPLGSVADHTLGRFYNDDGAEPPHDDGAEHREDPQDPVKILVTSSPFGTPQLVATAPDKPDRIFAEATFAPDAFVLWVSPGMKSVEVSYRLGEEHERLDEEEAQARAESLDELLESPSLLLWRLYLGPNSVALDGISFGKAREALYRVAVGTVNSGAILVGRVVLRRLVRPIPKPNDPLFNWRIGRAERRSKTRMLRLTGRSRLGGSRGASLVVAVHGTLSVAVPLAEFAKLQVGSLPVYRFEHDTFHSISENADELAELLRQTGASRVLFVAHSRGGLVASETMTRLQGAMRFQGLVALGTPFLGSPIADAAGMALAPLSGGFRFGAELPVVDKYTRLLFLLMGGKLPEGLRQMQQRDGFILATNYRQIANAVAIGGVVTPSTAGCHNGVARLTAPAFEAQPNDAVVAYASATARCAIHHQVAQDHFCYAKDPLVAAEITRVAGGL